MGDEKQGALDEAPDHAPEFEDCEEVYSAEYLLECASGEARSERLAELRRRIALGAYRVDPARIAEYFLTRRTAGDS
ncbi:MAG: flagellar biosynthesis anti-sigma factor FlgM [Myxococcales bacterium]|nr:flagellar biosynthesis anti-sigma factor FlgM [Myxococcales bacterium]